MAWKQESNTFVLVHGAEEPTDAEWDVYVAAMQERVARSETFKVLVVTPGAGPNMRQRKRLNDVIQGRITPTAVVTGSAIGRAVVSILRLRNPDIRAFEPERLEDAFGHLSFQPMEQERTRRTVEELRRSVGLTNLP